MGNAKLGFIISKAFVTEIIKTWEYLNTTSNTFLNFQGVWVSNVHYFARQGFFEFIDN